MYDKKMRKLLPFLIIGILLFSTSFAWANDKNFSTDYENTYDIAKNGETTVEQKVTITNLSNQMIPSNYTFSVKNVEMYDLQAITNGKPSKVTVETSENNSSFDIPIINYSIGIGNTNTIVISYKTKGIATQTGDIWNVIIPKMQIPQSTFKYNVKVLVPESFGQKMYFSPNPLLAENKEGKNIYYLTKETFPGTGISAGFGNYQTLNFNLKYQLENPFLLFSKYEIALPSDITSYQAIKYAKLTPKPQKTYLDQDGNAIASYLLWPKQKIQVELNGSAKLLSNQINPAAGGKFENLPKNLVQQYTKEQKYWEVNSTDIQEIAKQLKNPNINVVKNAQLAYNYVVENLTYDFEAINQDFVDRKGAEEALTKKGSWTCMEFADSFIALARAMGIPAREVNGYSFNNNENNKPISINLKGNDLLHAWAQFYDPSYGWVQIDPTWGNTSGIDYFTKLDTSHLAFAVMGTNSEYPLPAGGYRFNDQQKLIEVDYALNESGTDFEPRLKYQKKLNLNLFELFKGNTKYIFENTGQVFIYDLNGSSLAPNESKALYLPSKDRSISYKDSFGNIFTKDL